MLKKEDILNCQDTKIEPLEIPEWNTTVFVKTMSGAERDMFDSMVLEGRGPNKEVNIRNFRAKIAVCCLCDENGNRLFGDNDVEAVGKKSSIALDRISEAASALNALSKSDIKELEKNLPSGRNGNSISD